MDTAIFWSISLSNTTRLTVLSALSSSSFLVLFCFEWNSNIEIRHRSSEFGLRKGPLQKYRVVFLWYSCGTA